MATDAPPEHSGGPGPDRVPGRDYDRWHRIWSHREQLLKVARRRSMSAEDAEDAVQEAMLRAAENPHLDDDRLGAWLTTVTMRLCVDRYRQVNREAEVRRSPTLVTPGPMPVEEAVCDRAEAKWLARRSGALPGRQAEALWLKAEDLDVGQVAGKMGLSYRTVESLLARARRTLRNSLAATLGLALWLLGRLHPRTGGHAQAVAAASTAATLTVAGFVLLPHVRDAESGRTLPARPGASQNATAVTSGPDGMPAARPNGGHESGSPGSASTDESASPTGSGGLLPGVSLPPLPRLPRVSVSVPPSPSPPPSASVGVTVPSAPVGTGDVPKVSAPEVPDVSDVSEISDVSGVSDLPDAKSGLSVLPSTRDATLDTRLTP